MEIMDIITHKRRGIMYKKYFAIALISILTITASAFAGYYTTLIYTDKTAKSDDASKQSYTQGVNAQASSDKATITDKTVIKKTILYNAGADGVKVESEEKAGLDVVGFDKVKYEESIKKSGFKVSLFTEDKVEITKIENNLYPPNKFILKASGNFVSIYKSTEDGKLQNTGEGMEMEGGSLSEDIGERLKKGLIYETKEEAEEKLEEINS